MHFAAETLLPVDTSLAVALVVLLLVAAAVTAGFRLSPDGSSRRAREIVTAGLRAVAQLAAVSALIGWAVRHTPALVGFLLLMLAVAARTAGRRITGNGTWWWAILPVAAPVVPTVAGLVAAGLLTVPGIAVVPVSGILIGGAMTATALAGRRTLDELDLRHGEVEAGLALGLP
ncbi:ABC transporter permease, partial [Streptomyces sp. NPDC059762]|uniref:ABC transporter permease n=1 Tax=Streptomyces sp. NPDC059762 TaxID=3346938 RepID=UPI0036601A4C